MRKHDETEITSFKFPLLEPFSSGWQYHYRFNTINASRCTAALGRYGVRLYDYYFSHVSHVRFFDARPSYSQDGHDSSTAVHELVERRRYRTIKGLVNEIMYAAA